MEIVFNNNMRGIVFFFAGDLDRDFAVHARVCLLGVRASLGRGQGAVLDAVSKQPYGHPEIETLRTRLMANGPRLTKEFFKEILLLLVDRDYLRLAQKGNI